MSNKNFAVLNSLNLINKKLGDSYQQKGFNPFSDNFVLTPQGVEKLLEINIQKKNIESPKFFQESEKVLTEKFKQAILRADELLAKHQEIIKNGNASPKMLEEHIYIKICTELLKGANLKKLNYEELLEIIQTIYAMSTEYSYIYRRIFDKDFDVQLALTDFIRLCKITKTKKEIQRQKDLRSLVHSQYTQKTLFEKPKQPKRKEKEIEK